MQYNMGALQSDALEDTPCSTLDRWMLPACVSSKVTIEFGEPPLYLLRF